MKRVMYKQWVLCVCVYDGNNLERWLMNFVMPCYKRMNEGNFKQHILPCDYHNTKCHAAKKSIRALKFQFLVCLGAQTVQLRLW